MAPIILGLGAAPSGTPTTEDFTVASRDDRGMAQVTGATAGSYANFWTGVSEVNMFLGDSHANSWDSTIIIRFPVDIPQGSTVLGGVIRAELSGVPPVGLDFDILTLGAVEANSARITSAGEASSWVAGASQVGSFHWDSSEHAQYDIIEFPISGGHLTSVVGQGGWVAGNYIQFALRKSPQVRPGGSVGTLSFYERLANPMVLRVNFLE